MEIPIIDCCSAPARRRRGLCNVKMAKIHVAADGKVVEDRKHYMYAA